MKNRINRQEYTFFSLIERQWSHLLTVMSHNIPPSIGPQKVVHPTTTFFLLHPASLLDKIV